jgi:vWA-MoxR associated protein C-terminal domain/Trypsin-like peptidase domain/vWA-MoxR associated protein middle region (VMAP-M) 1
MSFGVDDYEKSIARIWYKDSKTVVGTGFLVAPGYVLTCAHVVLQAIGIKINDFEQQLDRPNQPVEIDFHILNEREKIQAEVVDWLPYRVDGGDVAVLRLLKSEPMGTQPIPLGTFARAELENEKHSVYGFPATGDISVGERSDDYRPKSNSTGGRFLLCKRHDSNDETIQSGFSGSPVWNEARQCVIGMIATATEGRGKAYAIPTEKLRPSLDKISAFCLHDVLVRSLDDCQGDERHQLIGTIDGALRQCHPNRTGNDWQAQLIEMLDLPPNAGWDAEGRLVQFVMQLVRMDEMPVAVYDRLKQWVEQRSLDFAALLERITREMKDKPFRSSYHFNHTMVIVDPVETSEHQVRVSLWKISDCENHNPYNAEKIILEHEITLDQLPQFIWERMGDTFGTKKPIIHYFVPRSSFCCDTAITPIGRRKRGLGCDYPFVIRTNLKTCPTGRRYRDNWCEKWESIQTVLNQPMKEVVRSVNCALPEDEIIEEMMDVNAAILQDCRDVGDLFDLIADDTALPVALWSREPLFQERLADMLDCDVNALRDRIRQERDMAHKLKSADSFGNHLSLVWEDPKIVPPDMRFDSDAC